MTDAITATAEALGVLVIFAARREGQSSGELVEFILRAVAEYAAEATAKIPPALYATEA